MLIRSVYFDTVIEHLTHLKLHESKNCSCEFKPLVKFVSGVAGTGKVISNRSNQDAGS